MKVLVCAVFLLLLGGLQAQEYLESDGDDEYDGMTVLFSQPDSSVTDSVFVPQSLSDQYGTVGWICRTVILSNVDMPRRRFFFARACNTVPTRNQEEDYARYLDRKV